MNRLRQIATNLSHAFADKVAINIRLSNQKRDLEARQLAITPAEGWEGKNAELREAAQKRAYAADPVCLQIEAEMRLLEFALGLAETALETAHAERRAEEWLIRCRLLEALTGNLATFQEDTTRVEDTAFEDVLDEIADARLEVIFTDPTVHADFYDAPHQDDADQFELVGIAPEEDIPF